MKYTYEPIGTCSRLMEFEIENDVIKSLKVIGGCNGNLQGISQLVKGKSVNEVIELLDGICCGPKPTSCPDQIAKGLKKYLIDKEN